MEFCRFELVVANNKNIGLRKIKLSIAVREIVNKNIIVVNQGLQLEKISRVMKIKINVG